MANNKNSVSDNEVKNASGGYVLEKGSDYVVYDDQTDKELKRYHRTNANDNARAKAFAFNKGYHLGKEAGNLEGQAIGFQQGSNTTKKFYEDMAK